MYVFIYLLEIITRKSCFYTLSSNLFWAIDSTMNQSFNFELLELKSVTIHFIWKIKSKF